MPDYSLVQLPNGSRSLRSAAYSETMHPGLGPVGEAEKLYAQQLDLVGRLRNHTGEFVIWDVGLGGAANVVTSLRLTREDRCDIRIISFDNTAEPARFALANQTTLGYLHDYGEKLQSLLHHGNVEFQEAERTVRWEFFLGDFPKFIADQAATQLAKPDAILFDAFSPARNPEMWTLPLFENLFNCLNPERPCSLATYSRSTMVRTAMLLAGFFVGRGLPSGAKEETTVAANDLKLIQHPLDLAWLERIQRSGSAEPLTEGTYRQAPFSPATLARLEAHPQFTQ